MCQDCEKKQKENEKIKEKAKSLGHIGSYEEIGYMCDSVVCSCGWKSNGYFDGYEWAFEEWIKHAEEIIKEGQIRLNI